MMYIGTIIVASLWLPLIAAIDDTGDIEDAPFCEKAMELSCGLPTEHCLFWDGYACQFTNLKDLCPKWCYNLDIQGRKMFIDPLADDFTIESDKERSICFFVMPPDCFNKFPTDICLKMHSHACSIPKVGEICKKSCEQDFVYENNATDNTTRDSSIEYQKDAVDAPFCDMAISSHCGQSLPMEVCQFWDAYACEFHNLNQTCPTKCLKTESEFKMLLTSDPFKFEKHENSSADEQVCDVLFSTDCPRTNSTKKCKDIFIHSCRIPAVATLCPKRCANDITYKEADGPSSTPKPSSPQTSTNQLSSHPSSISAPSARKSGNISECMNLNSPCGKGNKGRCKKTCEKYEQASGKCRGDSCKCCVLRDIIYKETDGPSSTPEPSTSQTSTNQLSSHPPYISAPSARKSGNISDIIHLYNKEGDPSSIPGPAPPQTSTNQLSSHPPSVSAPSAILSRNTSDIIHLYNKEDNPSSIPGPAPPQTSTNQLSSHPPSIFAPSAILSRNTSDNLSNEAEVELSIPQSSTPQPSPPRPSPPQPSPPQPSTSQPSTPQPSTPQPSTPQPSTPQTSTPQPSTSQPTTPQPSTPQSSTPQTSTPQPSTPQTSTPQPSTPQTSTPQSSTNQLPSHRSSIIAPSEKLLGNNSDNVHKEVDAHPPPPPPLPPPPPFVKLLENTGDKVNREEAPDEFILYDTLGSQTLFDPPFYNDFGHENVGQPFELPAIREEGCCEKVLSSACGLSEELCEIWKSYACSYRGFDKECPALCNKVVASKSNKKKIIPLVTSSEPQLLNKKGISHLLLQE